MARYAKLTVSRIDKLQAEAVKFFTSNCHGNAIINAPKG